MSNTSFEMFEVCGTAGELGRQHGVQAKDQIRGFVDYLAATLQLAPHTMRQRALSFLPRFEDACPQLLPEIEGLAVGADIEFADALAVQIRGELGQATDGGCTTFVIGRDGTANGQVLIGQTSDMPAEMMDYAYVLAVRPDDRPSAVMWTFGGMLGYHGLNEQGVAHFANSLGGGPAWKFALPHYPLKRLILEQAHLHGVRQLFDNIAVCSNGNYVLCDGDGNIADMELTSAGPYELNDAGCGYLAHSNHFLCSPCNSAENFAKSLPDSFPRLERMRELIAAKLGRITVADCCAFLSDHDGHPVSICRHPQAEGGYGDDILPASGHTVAALIAEPERGRFHVCRGNPCAGEFTEYLVSS